MTCSPKHGLVLAGSVVFVLPSIIKFKTWNINMGVVELRGYVTAQLYVDRPNAR